MSTLTIPVNGVYFDQIKAGTKAEEYRLVNPYWLKRLVGRDYSFVTLTRGYPKAVDHERRLTLPWRGYTVKTITHPHFGPDPVEVFAINVSVQTAQPAEASASASRNAIREEPSSSESQHNG